MKLIDLFRKKKEEPFPYWIRRGLEDAQAVDIDMLIFIRDLLIVVENRIEDQRRIIGEIRSGSYDTEQPARKRVNGRQPELREWKP